MSPNPELTVPGILVRPLNRELRDLADDVGILLTEFPNLTFIPVTRYASALFLLTNDASWIRY